MFPSSMPPTPQLVFHATPFPHSHTLPWPPSLSSPCQAQLLLQSEKREPVLLNTEGSLEIEPLSPTLLFLLAESERLLSWEEARPQLPMIHRAQGEMNRAAPWPVGLEALPGTVLVPTPTFLSFLT